jgi:feruloyl esterase
MTLALLLPMAGFIAARAADAPAPTKEVSASPGKSGGEGGGFGRDVTLKPATKENPYLETIVGQPHGAPTGDDPQTKCLLLAYRDFTGIPGAPTSIIDVTAKPSMDSGPMICEVNGYVAPQVGFRILLPLDTWNGKYMQNGCGGQCGGLIAIPCEVQVKRGYACLAADLGHRGTTYDSAWEIENLQSELDANWRATHVAAVAGKYITEHYYGKAPAHAYYQGSSTGGRQGLTEAQRFPTDFDGIIAGEGGPARFEKPAPGGGGEPVRRPRGGRALIGADGMPVMTVEDIRMLHKAVMDKCDADDGLKDGIITDPRYCAFEPKELLCKADKTPSCLTQKQVDAVNAVYNSGPQKGSEIGWIGAYVALDGTPGRYVRAEPAVVPQSTYFGGFGPANPDLSGFKAAGGKLIMFVGWADEVIDPIGELQYYEKVERVMGGRKETQDFYRFFMIPGQSHIPGGVGAESTDYIKALEDWVEKGQAPDVIVGHKLKWITQMMGPMYLEKDLQPSNYLYSRPIYPYPIVAHYKGKGDPDDAASFGPWDPVKKEWVKQ